MGSGTLGVEAQLQPAQHEAQPRRPTGKLQIMGQGADVLEEGLAAGQGCAHQPVVLVARTQQGVEQEGQQVQRRQQRRQMFLPVCTGPAVAYRRRNFANTAVRLP